jgi:hypothetical protein
MQTAEMKRLLGVAEYSHTDHKLSTETREALKVVT